MASDIPVTTNTKAPCFRNREICTRWLAISFPFVSFNSTNITPPPGSTIIRSGTPSFPGDTNFIYIHPSFLS
nr:MAG TPA: hypothetical protein [Caudoviricetes sp.]